MIILIGIDLTTLFFAEMFAFILVGFDFFPGVTIYLPQIFEVSIGCGDFNFPNWVWKLLSGFVCIPEKI